MIEPSISRDRFLSTICLGFVESLLKGIEVYHAHSTTLFINVSLYFIIIFGMFIEITFIGSGGWVAPLDRYPTSILLRIGGSSYMFEAGEGIYKRLLEYNLFPLDIKALFISHHHPDHILGLLSIGLYQRLMDGGVINIYLNEDAYKRFNLLREFVDPWVDEVFRVNIHGYDGVIYRDDTITVDTVKAHHKVGSNSYLISIGDKKIYYSGDTRLSGENMEYLTESNIVIHEASIYSNIELAERTGHTDLKEILSIIDKMKADKIFLIHLGYEPETEIKKVDERIVIPRDGETYKIL